MKKTVCTLLCLYLSLFTLSSCINIPVGSEKVEPSRNVRFKAPTPDFSKTIGTPSDHSWINNKTGSMISYKSECSRQSLSAKGTLENITNEFDTISTTELQSFKYNSRKAYRQKLTTEVEGVDTNFDVVVFKKYGCLFLITHTGLTNNFSSTESAFQKFLVAFEVQR